MNDTPIPPSTSGGSPQYRTPNSQPSASSRIVAILVKELREIFRDRRTIMSVVIGPLVVTPLLFHFMGNMTKSMNESARTKRYKIGILGGGSPAVKQGLTTTPNFALSFPTSQEEAEQWIKSRRVSAVLKLPDDMEARMARNETVPVDIMEDEGDQDSQIAASQLQAAFTALGQQELSARLQSKGLTEGFAKPFTVHKEPIASGGSQGLAFLTMFLPYILSLTALTGSIYAAFDQVAGEKERGTLETLLVSPASRRDIVLGKFGAVVCVCMLSSILSVIGMIISFSSGGFSETAGASGGLHLSLSAILVTLLVMLPQSILFAGVLLGISTFARNQKEAQTYISPLMMLILVPVLASLFLGPSAPLMSSLVPVLGSSIIIKQALVGSFSTAYIALAFGASILYAAVAVAFCVGLFQKESVLIKA